MKTLNSLFAPRPRASLLTGSLCCLLATTQHAQTVVTSGSSTNSATNNVPGYAGEAAAAFGFLGFSPSGFTSIGETTLLSPVGDAQEASALEDSLVAGPDGSGVEAAHATVIGQNGL